MSESKTIFHKNILWTSLILSITALPFSMKVCHAGMIVLLLGWLMEGDWSTKFRIIKQSLLLQIIIGLLVLQLIGLFYTDNMNSGLLSVEKKIFFYMIPVALATTMVRLTKNEIGVIFIGFFLSCLIGTILCIVYAWTQANDYISGLTPLNHYLATSSYSDLHPLNSEKWLIFSYVSLAEGINIHPTYFSFYLSFCVLVLLHKIGEIRSTLRQAGIWVLATYFMIFIIFLAARIVILAIGLMLIFLAIRSLINHQKMVGIAFLIMSIFFSYILYINPVSRYRSLQEIHLSTFNIHPGSHYETAAQIRASLWWTAFKSIQHSNPFLGVGSGDVETEMQKTSSQFGITNILGSFDPHSQYLFTLLGCGIVGLLLLILWIALPAYFSWGEKDHFFIGFVLLLGMICLTETALESQKGIVFSTLVYAILSFQRHSFQSISISFRPILRAGN